MPDLLHIVPIGDNAVLNGVLQGQHASLGLRLVSDEAVLVLRSHHEHGNLRASNDRGEDSTRGVVSGKAGLAHTRAIIDNQC